MRLTRFCDGDRRECLPTLFGWRDEPLKRARDFRHKSGRPAHVAVAFGLRHPAQRSTPEAGPLPFKFPAIGEFAGRARYVPGDVENLPPPLRAAAGTVMDVEFAGIACPGGRSAGQSLYRECSGQSLLGGLVIPEQDLDFIP